jgi:hypothetical protein
MRGGTINTPSLFLATAPEFDYGTINVNGGSLRGPAGTSLDLLVLLAGTEAKVNLLSGATSNIGRIRLGGSAGTATFTVSGGSVLTTSPTATGSTANIVGGSNSPGVSDAVGILTVTGAGSRWNAGGGQIVIASPLIGVGGPASGALNVLDGGTVSAGRVTIVGNDGTTGLLNVRGVGSSLSTTDLTVGGFFPNAVTFNLTDGATASSSATAGVGSFGGYGTANVARSGATWTVSGPLTIGADTFTGTASANLNIGGGGIVIATAGLTLNTSGDLRLNGGTLSTTNIANAGGRVHFNAGTINFTPTLWSPDFAELEFILGSANLTLGPGRTISAASFNLHSPLTLDGGTLAVGQITAGGNLLTLNRGTLRLTNSPLVVGSSGVLGKSLTLGPSMNLSITGEASGLAVAPEGLLLVTGGAVDMQGAGLSNFGEIQLSDRNATLGGAPARVLNNNGRLLGTGRVSLSLSNNLSLPGNPASFGQIRADAGDRLVFTGSGNSNGGLIQALGTALAPAEIEFTTDLSNKSQFAARNASLRFGGSGVANIGTIALSAGTSDITGVVTNNAGGLIAVSGNSTATFYSPLTNNAGAELRVSDGSTAVFFGPVTSTGSITGGGSKFFEGGASAAAAIETPGSTSVLAAASLDTPRVRERSLDVQGVVRLTPGGGNSRLDTLTIAGSPGAWTGKLDLSDNALILDYTGESPLAAVADQIIAGRAGGTWTGDGITSSTAATDPGRRSIGYAEASRILGPTGGTFLGEPVDATTVLARLTVLGDSNLDGAVSFADLVALAQNYNSAVGSAGWASGDYNGDGNVGFADLVALAQNYNSGLPAAPIAGASAEFNRDAAAAFASVPEPAAGWVILIALGVLAQKRTPGASRATGV